MYSAGEAADLVRRGELSAVELLDDCARRIETFGERLNAFSYLDWDSARRAAEEVDRRVASGEDPGPFAGVPLGVKDLEDCEGMPTRFGSLLYAQAPPAPSDSVHLRRLRAAGAVPVGKTTTPEFGTLNYTRNRATGVTRNPWNLAKTPGGSSGGSAAAVAGGLLPFATASDGGGSTRIPASFCGLVGMKPSFGRVPRPHPDDSQTAVFGVLVTCVRDAARHLDVTAGPDDRDRTSLPGNRVSYERAIEELDLRGLRAVWTPDMGYAVVDPEVRRVAEEAAMALVDAAGLELVEAEVRFEDPIAVWTACGQLDLWYRVRLGEDWPDRASDLTPYVRRVLEQTHDRVLPTLVEANERRQRLQEEVAELFEKVDVVLSPTTAVPAFAAEGPPPDRIAGVDVHPAMSVPFTMVANLCWNPACSVPAGSTGEGLPVGLQVMARRHRDDVVLRLARIVEEVRPWPRHAPADKLAYPPP
ncbi:MAG: amidase [Acidimicrobiales bacterium]|nr:MAG: amidase [Acidimicrobiales bacterium]